MTVCYVPSGQFWLGSSDADELAGDEEKPCHLVDLNDGYWIGQYPVTVAQFRAFVEATGYQVEDKRSLQDLPTHPVCYVTWYEAVAFCDWLTEAWRNILPPGWTVCLPSEVQWEKAARGGIGSSRPATIH